MEQSSEVLFICSAKAGGGGTRDTRDTRDIRDTLIPQIPDNSFPFASNVYMYDLSGICALTDQSGVSVPADGEQQWGCWVSG